MESTHMKARSIRLALLLLVCAALSLSAAACGGGSGGGGGGDDGNRWNEMTWTNGTWGP